MCSAKRSTLLLATKCMKNKEVYSFSPGRPHLQQRVDSMVPLHVHMGNVQAISKIKKLWRILVMIAQYWGLAHAPGNTCPQSVPLESIGFKFSKMGLTINKLFLWTNLLQRNFSDFAIILPLDFSEIFNVLRIRIFSSLSRIKEKYSKILKIVAIFKMFDPTWHDL